MSKNLAREGAPKKLPKVRIHDKMYSLQHGPLIRAGQNGGKALLDETLSGNKDYVGKATRPRVKPTILRRDNGATTSGVMGAGAAPGANGPAITN